MGFVSHVFAYSLDQLQRGFPVAIAPILRIEERKK